MRKVSSIIALTVVFTCGCRKHDSAAQQELAKQQAAQLKIKQPLAVPEPPKWDAKAAS